MAVSNVLVVQADSALNQDWCAAIESQGHAVISAQGVAEGLSRVREGGIDVILVDHWDSYAGLSEFVEQLNRLPDPPPFVLISDSPRAPEISARLGAAVFLPKPCAAEDIIAVAQRFGSVCLPSAEFEDESTEPRGLRSDWTPPP